MLVDTDTLKWMLAFLSPAVVGFWAWWIARQAAREKRVSDGFSYTQAKDASMVAFGEGLNKDATSQLAEITSQALQQNYKLNDGMLTRMFEAVTAGNLAQEAQQVKVFEAITQVVASQNKTIEQNAKLIEMFSELMGRTQVKNVMSDMVKTATMNSPSVQAAEDVASAATDVKE